MRYIFRQKGPNSTKKIVFLLSHLKLFWSMLFEYSETMYLVSIETFGIYLVKFGKKYCVDKLKYQRIRTNFPITDRKNVNNVRHVLNMKRKLVKEFM